MGNNTFTGGYADGNALTKALLDTAYQTLQLDVSNTALMTTGSTAGQALISTGSGTAAAFSAIPDPKGPFALRNYGLKATVATGVMTVNLKTNAGTAPSGSDIVDFVYSTNGVTSATYSAVQVTAATSIAINSSASLGYTATTASSIFVYGYYNTVTSSVKLAVSARSELDCGRTVGTTQISASADSADNIYATAALTVVPRLLGVVIAAHNSAGAWQTPTSVNITNDLNPLATATANNIASAITSTGADLIGADMTSTGANAIAASMSATGANAIAATMTSTGANAIGNDMGASGANNVANVVNSAASADHLLSVSNLGGVQSTTSFNTATLGAFDNIASLTVTSSGRYMVWAHAKVNATGLTALRVRNTTANVTLTPSIPALANQTITLLGTELLTASDSVVLQGSSSVGGAVSSGDLVLMLLYKT